MILDPTGRFIATIMAHCDIREKDLLEVGCGKGRVTRDLARYARRVVATDPDESALEKARGAVSVANVEFVCCRGEELLFPENSFDVVVFPLSLHHIAPAAMVTSLRRSMGSLRAGGCVIVIEPDEGGTMTEAKERFGAGSGDEREAKKAALRAVEAREGWSAGKPVRFTTLFSFADESDFLANMLPGHAENPPGIIAEVKGFLERHRRDGEIVLDSDRLMIVLTPTGSPEAGYAEAPS